MFEAGLSVSIYLVNSIAGSNYMQKFLRGKYQKKFVLFAWTSLYFIIQGLILERFSRTNPLNGFAAMLADIAVILLLLMLLYKKDLSGQFFVTVSFVAGKEIIKYVVSVSSAIWCNMILFFIDPNTMKTSEQAALLKSGLEFSMYIICILLYALMITDYVLALKGNQGSLYEEVKEYFADKELTREIEKSGNYKKTKEKAWKRTGERKRNAAILSAA